VALFTVTLDFFHIKNPVMKKFQKSEMLKHQLTRLFPRSRINNYDAIIMNIKEAVTAAKDTSY